MNRLRPFISMERIVLLGSAIFACDRLAVAYLLHRSTDARAHYAIPAITPVRLYSDSIDAWAVELSARDIFLRAATTTTAIAGPMPVATNPRQFNTLRLQGLVGSGIQMRALLIGVPGREETVVVVAGDSFPGMKIKKIDKNSVSIRTADSTLVLFLGGAKQ